eukprot:5657981-Prymnesium_polylepis.1
MLVHGGGTRDGLDSRSVLGCRHLSGGGAQKPSFQGRTDRSETLDGRNLAAMSDCIGEVEYRVGGLDIWVIPEYAQTVPAVARAGSSGSVVLRTIDERV